MEFRHMEYFTALAEELHFTRAAERVGITQPSLSQQIRLLEDEFGTSLFDRIGKKTALTEAGAILLQHCYHIMHELQQARVAIRSLQGLQRGSMDIGALSTLATAKLPSVLMAFHREFPSIKVTVRNLLSEEIYDAVLQNLIDVGLCYLQPEHAQRDQLECIPLYTERLVLITPLQHPLANVDAPPLSAIASFPCLLPAEPFLRRVILKACESSETRISPALEIDSLEGILAMVREGLGLAIVPSSLLQESHYSRVTAIPLEQDGFQLEVGMVYRKHKFLCAASRVFLERFVTAYRD
ncbi:LysR family transcriptional regulator [Paenibacillus zeisoli]|nr:LysR family transcriptional regulator [Paenibacillus zeisoli]